jgi:hypothetical protein
MNDAKNGAISIDETNSWWQWAFADGYWAKVKPKKAGTYVLKTYGVVPDFEFALDITYTLEVVVEGPDPIFEETSE